VDYLKNGFNNIFFFFSFINIYKITNKRIFNSGTNDEEESQEFLLEELNKKVKDVYKKCIGDNDANLSTLQMLTNVENRLEQLFEMIELMPPDKVEQAEKVI